jgi:hypothetical protein
MRLHTRKNCILVGVGLGLVGMAMGGCQGTPAYQGSQRDILATYRVRRLTADLPGTVRVPAVVAVGRAVLMSRGYTVTTANATEDAGQVEAEPADAGILESISIDIRQRGAGVRVQIIAEPIGSQTKSRAILDAMLSELGL